MGNYLYMNNESENNSDGFVVLTVVLVVTAVGVVIATATLLLGISSIQNSLAVQQSVQARALADSCAEEGLKQIKDSVAFEGIALTVTVMSKSFHSAQREIAELEYDQESLQ